MNPAELQALRRLLFFSRQEAAAMVASSQERPSGVSDRAWRMWEDGERPVPEDVAGRLLDLAKWQERAVAAARAQVKALPARSVAMVWYATLDDWATLPGREPILWRPQQSVCAALLGAMPDRARLVPFDAPAYAQWLGGGEDNEAMRGVWAASLPSSA